MKCFLSRIQFSLKIKSQNAFWYSELRTYNLIFLKSGWILDFSIENLIDKTFLKNLFTFKISPTV